MNNLLGVDEQKLDIKYFLFLMLFAFVFSMSVRYIWVDMFSSVESFRWNNELMLNTNDGYYYAEGARDIVAGSHEANDLSPVDSPLSRLTAFIAQTLPISFETLILWMPAFFGSLLIVPIMLIARVFNQDLVGFFAALLGGVVWSYYNRTMVGYYDTDMLVVVLPTFFLWGVLYSLKHQDSDSIAIAAFSAIIAMYWHDGMVHIVNGVFFMTLLYTIIFERSNLYFYKFLSVIIFALTTLPIAIKIFAIIAFIAAFHYLKEKVSERTVIALVVISTIIYLVFGGVEWITRILNNMYISRLLHADDVNLSLHYFGVVKTVREAGNIPFEVFANRISGHTITFWISLVGYLLFAIRYRLFILTLPMVVLGFFALQGGLRFTVFAVPFMALGLFYLVFLVAQYLQKGFTSNLQPVVKYGLAIITTSAILYPNITHIKGYKVPTVFNVDEVKVLDTLGKMASREDYVVAWWDYGYPIRYYADVKTPIDGGKHDGASNFPTSFSLLNNQTAAANMMRLDIEFTEANFQDYCGPTIECMLKKSNVKDPNILVQALNNKQLQLPRKTRDVYVYLPNRMLDILPTVDLFSNIDLVTGKAKKRPLFILSRNFNENDKIINLGNGMQINKSQGTIKLGNQVVPMNHFVMTEYNPDGKLMRKVQKINAQSNVNVIFMKNYNQFLILDSRLFNSLYIQLFVLENPDLELFEPVIASPHVKVYKLKK